MSQNILWTVSETANFLQLQPKTIYEFVSRKTIPHIKIGRTVRFSPKEIEVWVASKVQTTFATNNKRGAK